MFSLVAFLGVVFGSLALSANYNYCVSHDGQHYTGQHNQNGAPIVEGPIEHPNSISLFVFCGGIYANENGAGITAFATVLLTIVTGLLSYLAWDQSKTSRAELRAYAHISKVDLKRVLDGSAPKARFTIRNFGHTPARKVRIGTAIFYGNYPLDIPLQEIEAGEDARTLAPADEFTSGTSAKFKIDRDELSALRMHASAIYLRVIVKYDDVFGRERVTETCMFCNGASGIDQDGDGIFAAYSTGNSDT